jgi:alkanesulfonate monooxygenase SsuD/methylene tetrahydromethanopterin reductase-like flavin-dependent oxidoreductase (luciferase family)
VDRARDLPKGASLGLNWDALSNGRLMLGIGAGYQPYEFERVTR